MRLRQSCIAIVVLASASAQTPETTSSNVFEAASIKASGPQSARGSNGGPGSKDPGRYFYHVASLRDLIAVAWKVEYFQIASSAALDKQSFDLDASVPPGTSKEQFRVMLRNLLTERFQLRSHLESRDFPAYELVVAKTGLKIREAVPDHPDPPARSVPGTDDGWPELPPNTANMAARNSSNNGFWLVRLKAQLQTFSQLAAILQLAAPGDLPIVDKTGLSGRYSFALEYTKDLPGTTPDGPSPAPDLTTALQQQLGLQLISKKLPFDVVVVESFARLPSEN
jgi:uncharacterized protein (TIGR03435 family)